MPANSSIKSQIENATEDVMFDLNADITHNHRASNLVIPEKEFRRIIALYFERLTIVDWCQQLGIEPTDSDRKNAAPGEK